MALRDEGFTIIEMMVVVAIVAILAMMAVPSYQNKFIREQITEALPLADIAEKPIAAFWATTHAFPADNAAAGLPTAEKIVSNLVESVAVEQGVIHIRFGNRSNALIRGKTLSLRPAVVSDAPIVPVAWICGYAEAPKQMSIQGGNKTDIPSKYLPQKCRATAAK
jgi:type IV pilus assembly protein PilA